MNKIVTVIIAGLFIAAALPPKKQIKVFLAGDSTIAIKSPATFPETGWGMPFVQFWDSTVTIENRAKNGRSTKTFIKEGLWQTIYEQAAEGDYVFIQFGHNDESIDKGERYATPDTFRMNLRKFVNETRSKKAIPILITPVSRRKFDNTGTAVQTHGMYSGYVREVAKELNVPLIDLDEKSRALYQQFGPENSKWLFLQLQAGEHPNYPDGRNDNTHFSEFGARLIAQIVLKEVQALQLELADRIVVRKK